MHKRAGKFLGCSGAEPLKVAKVFALFFSLQLILLRLIAFPILWIIKWYRMPPEREFARRVRNGLCTCCGYDLRAGHLKCPECGVPVRIRHFRLSGEPVPAVHVWYTLCISAA